MTKKPEYKAISIKEEFALTIEDFIHEHPELGYRSIAQFLEDASRRRLELLKSEHKELPRFEQVNTDENGVKVLDRQLKRVADVQIKPSGAKCILDDSSSCEHVRFALSLPEVQDLIRKKGWKLPERGELK